LKQKHYHYKTNQQIAEEKQADEIADEIADEMFADIDIDAHRTLTKDKKNEN
jgi:hypothetical protein